MNVNFEPIRRGLKTIFLSETKCKIRFIYVGRIPLQKKKSGVKKCLEIMSIKGGGVDA